MPPRERGGEVGQKENSCIRSWVREVIRLGRVVAYLWYDF